MNVEALNFQPTIRALTAAAPGTDSSKRTNTDNSFDSFYNAYLNIMNETNQYQIEAENLQVDYVTGKTDDMLAVVLAQEKAYASLNFTVQVTNKIIDAYREIMRISM